MKLNNYFINIPIAHRGLHSDTVSENSMEAFKLAIEKGYAIEIDIHLLKDGKIAILHDEDLTRVTGKKAIIEELTSQELKNYPLLLNGETIPLLEDILKLIDGKVPLLIELKFGEKFDKNQAIALLKLLETYPYKDKIALQSFNPKAVRFLKQHTDEYAVGFLTSYNLNVSKFKTYLCKSLVLLKWMQADFISYDIRYVDNKYVKKYQNKGYQTLVWTINSFDKIEKANTYADNIIFEKVDLEKSTWKKN